MNDFGKFSELALLGIGACIGYIFGALVMSVPLILQGVRNWHRVGSLSKATRVAFEVFFSSLALASVFLLPVILGQQLRGILPSMAWLIAGVTCTVTVLVIGKIFVQIGIFRSEKGSG